ncbi:MAG: PD40 domain-containing protein [Verrucomicrobia bacterium]|nr:PD40 domain-containing protein [Verrucomicrobiota bacterium]
MKNHFSTLLTLAALCMGLGAVQGQTGLAGKIVLTDSNYDLYLLSMDTGVVQRLTTTKQSYEDYPELSLDGTEIVFHAADYSTRGTLLSHGLYVMQAAPEGPSNPRVRLTTGGTKPAWSPDGTQIVFSCTLCNPNPNNGELWLMDADGSGAHSILSSGVVDPIDSSWAPSGQIVFSGYTDSKNGRDLYTFDPVSLVLTRLTSGSGADDWPAWSPDARWIVISCINKTTSTSTSGIYLMPADGSQLPTLILKGGSQPSWGP